MTGILRALFGKERPNIKTLQTTACLDNPVELGHVPFLRDFALAQQLAKQHNLPIFLLFQEIPGCITCSSFGQNVLQDPQILHGLENAFVPVAINNRGLTGADRRVLRQFQEPQLNNPIVRFVNSSGKDLIPRMGGIYASSAIKARMQKALQAANRKDLLVHLKP